ncbi:MAG TPA: heme NO-binding domain-containing protein [Gemmatimonadaceae bacterium]|nr:heme NO-binding domain-containing protein [Gemmatimonadaceae bacterium]
MHGLIHAELRRFVTTNLGSAAWDAMLTESGVGTKAYLATAVYPDAEIVALVGAAVKLTGLPAGKLLHDFGEFMAPTLIGTYKAFVKPEWKTLDLLENTERTIHKVVRMKDAGAQPPHLRATRPSTDEVIIEYDSPRKMCDVAKGIVKGVAAYYKEGVVITEAECMNTGGKRCRISVRTNGVS